MKHTESTTLEEFYKEAADRLGKDMASLLPPGITKEVGHFNIFSIEDTIEHVRRKSTMPYNRRAYYKISLIRGKSVAEYADKVIDIEQNALLFATPNVPYHWIPLDTDLTGIYCIFTHEFLFRHTTGMDTDELPIFKAGGCPVFLVNEEAAEEIAALFKKMQKEIASDYAFKYDLLRNYVLELIHYGQKLQPATATHPAVTASARATSMFIELLERQFPIESPSQKLRLRTAREYADQLAIHVNHLNKVLKEHTGKTTTELISSRVVQEAKIILRHTDWTISEIAWCLGFEEVAHFSNFFKKHTNLTPVKFRS